MSHESRYNNLGGYVSLPEYGSADLPKESWWKLHDVYQKMRNTCAVCGELGDDLRNFSTSFRDGDLYCKNGHHVRGYDAG